jgi:ATP-dependent DNA helicase RecG
VENWENRAIALLDKCLTGVVTELNELDWKAALSPNKDRLAQHLSAFANSPNGGFLVYGISNEGELFNIDKDESDKIVNKLGSLARQAFFYPISIEHSLITYQRYRLLLVYVKENQQKPVALKKNGLLDCYKRSAKQTVKMGEEEARSVIGAFSGVPFERRITRGGLTASDVFESLDYKTYWELSGKKELAVQNRVVELFESEQFVVRNDAKGFYSVTNLGAVLFSKDLNQEGILKNKRLRVIHYKGTNKLYSIKDQWGQYGYALAFRKIVKYIMDALPINEIIKTVRQELTLYPEVAIREFIANALIHQDFSITGANVTIEIFADRMEITNPGVPIIDIDRIIDTPPKSRNVILSEVMMRLGICEKRGSGVQRSLFEIEAYQLPAPKFIRGDDYTKVILYAPIPYQEMTLDDRIRACYQHCALHYVSSLRVNNESVRERFKISKSNYPIASKIIAETIKAGWIKQKDPESESKKHRTYVPYWAE